MAQCSEHSPPPDLLGHFDDEPQLGPLLVLGQRVAFLGRSEAALARKAKLLDIAELRRLIDAAMMTADEIAWLDAYHAGVAREVAPLIDDDATKAWLATATAPLRA